MIHDRGNKKWASLMLPEHKRKLVALYQEQFYENKPFLDEQKNEELNHSLAEALSGQQVIRVVFFHNRGIHFLMGKVKKVDLLSGELCLVGEEGNLMSLKMNEIIEIEVE